MCLSWLLLSFQTMLTNRANKNPKKKSIKFTCLFEKLQHFAFLMRPQMKSVEQPPWINCIILFDRSLFCRRLRQLLLLLLSASMRFSSKTNREITTTLTFSTRVSFFYFFFEKKFFFFSRVVSFARSECTIFSFLLLVCRIKCKLEKHQRVSSATVAEVRAVVTGTYAKRRIFVVVVVGAAAFSMCTDLLSIWINNNNKKNHKWCERDCCHRALRCSSTTNHEHYNKFVFFSVIFCSFLRHRRAFVFFLSIL